MFGDDALISGAKSGRRKHDKATMIRPSYLIPSLTLGTDTLFSAASLRRRRVARQLY